MNYDETDDSAQKNHQQHYLSTANLNINESMENHSNLEELNRQYGSTNRLAPGTPKNQRSKTGVDNQGFHDDDARNAATNGVVKSTFDESKAFTNGDLNASSLALGSPTKEDDEVAEAVNLELINLKPSGKDVAGPYEYGTNGISGIPVKKEADVETGNPYDEYFVPVNEHRKYMR